MANVLQWLLASTLSIFLLIALIRFIVRRLTWGAQGCSCGHTRDSHVLWYFDCTGTRLDCACERFNKWFYRTA